MDCELLATCSALGYLEGDTYHKEHDCIGKFSLSVFNEVIPTQSGLRGNIGDRKGCTTLDFPFLWISESVKDLIRFLRHEDDSRDVRQQLGAAQIVQNDLLPIIIQHGQDKTLFDACIRYIEYYTVANIITF